MLQVVLVAIAFIYFVVDGLSHGTATVHDSVAGIINVDQQFDFALTVMGSNSSDSYFVKSLSVIFKRVLSLNYLFNPEIV